MIEFDDLNGFKIQAEDGEIGSIHDLLFDDEACMVRYVVAQTGMWLFSRKALIAPKSLMQADEARRLLSVSLTKDEVKNSPEISADPPLTREQEAIFHDYYKMPYYWEANAFDRLAEVSIAPEAVDMGSAQPGIARAPEIPEGLNDPALRSARDTRGIEVMCGNESVGKVDGLLVDIEAWNIPYLVLHLKHEDKRILAPVSALIPGSWADNRFALSLGLDKVNSAPVYDETVRRDKRFLQGVADHYQRNI